VSQTPNQEEAISMLRAFSDRQEVVVTLTQALRVANKEADRLREGIQAILDDAWLSRADDVLDALRELISDTGEAA
jgi:hypothetical protein